MIIASTELAQLDAFIQHRDGGFRATAYIAQNPHLLLACGFDEVRLAPLDAYFDFDPESKSFEDFRLRFFKAMDHDNAAAQWRTILDQTRLTTNLTCRRLDTGLWFENWSPPNKEPGFRFPPMIHLVPRGYRYSTQVERSQLMCLDAPVVAELCRRA